MEDLVLKYSKTMLLIADEFPLSFAIQETFSDQRSSLSSPEFNNLVEREEVVESEEKIEAGSSSTMMRFDTFSFPWNKLKTFDGGKLIKLLEEKTPYDQFNKPGATQSLNKLCTFLAEELMSINQNVPKAVQDRVVQEIADKFPISLKQRHPITKSFMAPYNMLAVLKGRIKRNNSTPSIIKQEEHVQKKQRLSIAVPLGMKKKFNKFQEIFPNVIQDDVATGDSVTQKLTWLKDISNTSMDNQKANIQEIIDVFSCIFSDIRVFFAKFPSILEMKANFPLLFNLDVLTAHFQQLTGIDMKNFNNNFTIAVESSEAVFKQKSTGKSKAALNILQMLNSDSSTKTVDVISSFFGENRNFVVQKFDVSVKCVIQCFIKLN
jgi:hypothetical protein